MLQCSAFKTHQLIAVSYARKMFTKLTTSWCWVGQAQKVVYFQLDLMKNFADLTLQLTVYFTKLFSHLLSDVSDGEKKF